MFWKYCDRWVNQETARNPHKWVRAEILTNKARTPKGPGRIKNTTILPQMMTCLFNFSGLRIANYLTFTFAFSTLADGK